MNELTRWADQYTSALEHYLNTGGGEDDLQRAYAVGRELIKQGLGLVDLANVHSQALSQLLPTAEKQHGCVVVTQQAAQFFAEGLSPFEMALRGFQEANEALLSLNASLEQRVSERTEDLQRVNAELHAVLDTAPAMVLVTDSQLRVKWLNHTAAVGLNIAEPFALQARDITDSIEAMSLTPGVFARVLAGEPMDVTGLKRTHQEGERWYDMSFRPVRQQGSIVGVLLFATDITERRRAQERERKLEEQMRATQRMEAVGRLAGGVAHDFNNLLTVISSYAGFLRENFPEGDDSREDAEMILDAADRATKLTSQLLAFGRRQVQDLRLINVNEVLEDLGRLLPRLINESIQLVVEPAVDLGPVVADPTQLEQVVMNLVVNARDAMPGGGRLTLSTRNISFEELRKQHLDVRPGDVLMLGDFMVLEVTDTGVGMTDEVQAKIFEPFFTTKGDKGTGLGLATVYGIVKQSGGYITVDSELGRGTRFQVFLPHASSEESEAAEAPRKTGTLLAGDEVILLVEDEEPVRKAAARILTRAGFQVIESADPQQALAHAMHHPGHIDVLLTDIVMPGLDGKELAAQVRVRRPEIKIVYMSGYAERGLTEPVPSKGPRPIMLTKPFTPETLVRKVRAALDEP